MGRDRYGVLRKCTNARPGTEVPRGLNSLACCDPTLRANSRAAFAERHEHAGKETAPTNTKEVTTLEYARHIAFALSMVQTDVRLPEKLSDNAPAAMTACARHLMSRSPPPG